MIRIFFFLILALEIFALANRGGGPLLSHLFLTGITFLAVIACMVFRDECRPKCGFIGLGYGLFFLAFLISLAVSKTPGYSLAPLLLFANLGILFFMVSGLKISERHLQWFSIGLIGLAVIDTLIGYFIYTQTPFPRFAGTFIDLKEHHASFGNDFANFLLLILPLSLWQFFKKHRRFTTTLATGFAAAVLISGFVLSFSRGAWLSLFAAAVIAAIWAFLQRRRIKPAVSARTAFSRGIALFVISILLINSLQFTRGKKFQATPLLKKITFQADEGSASAGERLQFWKGALKLIGERPMLGSGILSFKYLYPKYQPSFGANWDHPHNIFLKIGVENGLFALVFFALFLIGIAVVLLQFLWRKPWHPSLPFILGGLGAFGHNLVDFNFIVSNFTLFMVFLALAISFPVSDRQSPIPNSSLRFFSIAVLFLFLLALHEGFYNIDFKRGRAALAAGNLDAAASLLENPKKLFFERDLANYLALAYRKKFEATNDPIWRARETDLLAGIVSKTAHASAGTADASLVFRLGELALEQKSFEKAEQLFKRAIGMDPANRLRYYYELVRVKQIRKVRIETALREKILALLQEYRSILPKNRHFTVLTDNPAYASKLFEFFGLKKEQTEFDAMWFQELLKFSAMYGKIQKPLLGA